MCYTFWRPLCIFKNSRKLRSTIVQLRFAIFGIALSVNTNQEKLRSAIVKLMFVVFEHVFLKRVVTCDPNYIDRPLTFRGVAVEVMVGVAPLARFNVLDIVFDCILQGLRYTIKSNI